MLLPAPVVLIDDSLNSRIRNAKLQEKQYNEQSYKINKTNY